jgi:Cu+-exporting ATPase
VKTELAISGMTCASCVAHVGRALRKISGVTDATVNLATERASITHEPAVDPTALVSAVENAGYGAVPVRDRSSDEDARRRDAEIRRKGKLLALSIVLFVPTLALGMTPLNFAGKDWLMLALTLPVWLIVGAEFHRGALAALRHGTSNMDTLVSLGSTVAFAYSVYAAIALKPSYFETASAIVTLIFIGKYLETAARGSSNRAIRALLDLRPSIARVRRPDGSVQETPVDSVRIGQELLIAAGERVPVDGIVEEGESAIDASMLTGEPIPVAVSPGSEVKQGTLNGDGTLIVRAQEVGEGTALARIVELVRRAQGTTPPVQRLADRVAGIFVPTILMISAITFIAWIATHHQWPAALSTAIAVLVIACPCALGLATPTAIIAGVGAAAKRGLLFRDAEAIERLGTVTTVLFDKTGTLTLGKPEVQAIHRLAAATDGEILATAASLEQASTHPLASAIVRAARDCGITPAAALDVVAQPGAGLRGSIDGRTYLAGNAQYMAANSIALDGAASPDTTRVYIADASGLLGAIDLGDSIRPQAAEAVSRLQDDRIEVALVSGDALAPTQTLAETLHVPKWHARVTPQEKAAVVRAARAHSARVAFVGDGINDAPALATADVGIAMGGGTEIALETAQVAILSNDPRAVATGIEISRATLRTIKQNLFWAFAYNAILVPIAAAGFVSPMFAAAAMGASSLFVVGNSLLLQRKRR